MKPKPLKVADVRELVRANASHKRDTFLHSLFSGFSVLDMLMSGRELELGKLVVALDDRIQEYDAKLIATLDENRRLKRILRWQSLREMHKHRSMDLVQNAVSETVQQQMRSYGKLLRQLRTKHEFHLGSAADALGVTAAKICDVEFSRHPPFSEEETIKLCELMGEPAAELLNALSLAELAEFGEEKPNEADDE